MAYYRNRTKKRKNNYTAYETALYLLNYRVQSEKELTRKLKEREYSDEDIAAAMEKLKHYQYVDDASMAEDLFESYRRKGLYGDIYIHQKMKLKGLSIDRHISVEEETEWAISLLTKKGQITPKLLEDYGRAAAFLSRRGFSRSAISAALHEFDFSTVYED